PRQLLIAQVLRHLDREHAPLPAGQKMGRLALIRSARLDLILRPDGNVELLFRVAIEVADEQVDRAVAIPVPALVRAGDARSALANRIRQRELRRRLAPALLASAGEHATRDRPQEQDGREGESSSAHTGRRSANPLTAAAAASS